MFYALSETGERITPVKHGRAICPLCQSEVISKCGDIYCHHWAHKSIKDCDPWSESESEWHLNWKKVFPKDYTEVTLVRNEKRHRADIVAKDGTVIELQHSPISSEVIRERESFYKDMIWIFDMSDESVLSRFTNLGRLVKTARYYHGGWVNSGESSYHVIKWELIDGREFSFAWHSFRKSLLICERPVYFDFGKPLILRIVSLDDRGYGGVVFGKGSYIRKNELITKFGGTPVPLHILSENEHNIIKDNVA